MPQSARCAGIVCRSATNSTWAGGAESFVKLRKAPEVLAYGHQMTNGHGETEGTGYRSGCCGWSLAPDTAAARCFAVLPAITSALLGSSIHAKIPIQPRVSGHFLHEQRS